MKTYSLKHRRLQSAAGFTLIELLVVITIISVLAGFMFPAAKGVMAKAERSNAENTAYNLKNAISAYNTEYRKFPVRSGSNDGDTTMYSDHELMDVLLAADNQTQPGGLNPRRISFYSGKKAKRAAGGKYRKGVHLESGGAGELWDPYTEYYEVTMDTDYNNRVKAPEWDTGESTDIPGTIIVWSNGAKTGDSEIADNIKTW
ncbi:type II secretion system GspH family protein [Verrucomicrobiales bacterium]|nr:type II secretion system GspH family protein [Verrucomicrobiales bacterium]